jgi:phosphohistidine phosphatase
MKTLIFMRHGKSDWSSKDASDRDRRLAPRGKEASRLMGTLLSRTGEVPDSVLASSALRVTETVERAAKSGNWRCSFRITDRLYDCSPSDILDEIRAEPDSTKILLVAGHEPSLSESISLLTGRFRLRFPTAAVARLGLPITHWSEAEFDQAELTWLLTPSLVKKLKLSPE